MESAGKNLNITTIITAISILIGGICIVFYLITTRTARQRIKTAHEYPQGFNAGYTDALKENSYKWPKKARHLNIEYVPQNMTGNKKQKFSDNYKKGYADGYNAGRRILEQRINIRQKKLYSLEKEISDLLSTNKK